MFQERNNPYLNNIFLASQQAGTLNPWIIWLTNHALAADPPFRDTAHSLEFFCAVRITANSKCCDKNCKRLHKKMCRENILRLKKVDLDASEYSESKFYNPDWGNLEPLHMSPVDRAGSVTEMKLLSLHMVTFSPLSEMKNLENWWRDNWGVKSNEQAWREFLDFLCLKNL